MGRPRANATPASRVESRPDPTPFALTRGAQLVGAVPSFDAETLAARMRAHGICPSWHHRLRCVESLTAGFLGREVGGLKACAEALGIAFDPAAEHTALGDAWTARAIWDHVFATHRAVGS